MSSSQLGRNEKSSSRCVNWGHSMALNHLPPKSPSIPSIPTPSTSASSTSTSPYPGCAVRVPGYGATAAAAAAMAHHHHNQHHHHHRRSPSASFVPDVEPSWLEELLDSPKAPAAGPIERPSHRRSASDSFALEAPSSLRRIDDIAEEDEFYADREEQLASMFSDALKISSSSIDGGGGGGSMWQDRRPGHNSLYRGFSGDLSYGAAARMASEAAAAELDEQSQQQLQGDQTDIKRSKRQSAQRSRVRKLQYIHELEGNVSDLQNEVSGLSTQVALVDHQLLALHLDNAALKQSAAALAQEARIRDAHTEALTKEIQRLKFLKQQQQQQQRLRQQLALASASTAASAAATSASAANNVETTTATKHVRRASAGSVHDLGSASDVLDYSFVKFVEKTDSPVLRSSCTLAGNGKSLEVGAGRLSGAPPGFVVHNHL